MKLNINTTGSCVPVMLPLKGSERWTSESIKCVPVFKKGLAHKEKKEWVHQIIQLKGLDSKLGTKKTYKNIKVLEKNFDDWVGFQNAEPQERRKKQI